MKRIPINLDVLASSFGIDVLMTAEVEGRQLILIGDGDDTHDPALD